MGQRRKAIKNRQEISGSVLAALTLLFVVALLLCHPLVDDKEKSLYYGMLRIWVYMLMTPAAYACGGAMLACKLSVFPIY